MILFTQQSQRDKVLMMKKRLVAAELESGEERDY